MDGIGPGELTVESLLSKLNQGQIKEVIMALSATMEGDTTVFYLFKKMWMKIYLEKKLNFRFY